MRKVLGAAKRKVSRAKRKAIGDWELKKNLHAFRKVNLRTDLQLMPAGGLSLISRIDPDINLATVTNNSANTLRHLLRTHSIPFFELYQADWEAQTLHLLADRTSETIAEIKRSGVLRHWYFQELDRRGRRVGSPQAISALDAGKEYAGFTLYERVCSDLQARLVSTPRQGVSLHFWLQVEVPISGQISAPTDQELEANGLKLESPVTATQYFDGQPGQERYQIQDGSSDAASGSAEFSHQAVQLPEDVPSPDELESFEPVIESLVWNSRATQLPDPRFRNDEYVQALAEAREPGVTDVNFPIDAVYMWVDGSDLEWQRRKAETLGETDVTDLAYQATVSARFEDHDELRYSIRSICQYAPWIRKLWIVTDKQVPKWLDTENLRVEVVDHRSIWPDSIGIPSFNSHAIESNLHRIQGLAENYLIFNDDVFLARPVRPNLFFHASGIGSVFLSRALAEFGEHSQIDNVSTSAAKNARRILTEAGIPTFSRKFYHTPLPLRKSIMREVEGRFIDDFTRTRASQFRSKDDIAASGSVYFNYALATGAAVPGRIAYEYVDPGVPEGRQRLARLMRKRNVDTFVINDGSSPVPDYSAEDTSNFIQKNLKEYFPVPSEFEI